MIGTILGPYRLLAPLGAGAAWEIHAAEDTRSGRRVAIKLLRNRPAPGPAWPETRETTAHPVEAINEAPGLDTPHRRQERRGSCLVPEPLPQGRANDALRAASLLQHPNICALYDFGDFGGRIYVVVEALEGPPLPALLAGGALETGRLLDVGVQVAAALAEAHGRGVVHGGLTAGHVHVDDAVRVKVRDFGLAGVRAECATPAQGSASTAGAGRSASYMAPELARGEPIDPRADLFSFGVILYEMATGRLPFAGATEAQVIEAVLHHDPASPGTLNPRLPIGLVQLVNEALCKEPAERHTGAAGIRDRLAEIRQAPGGLDGLLPAQHVSTGSAVYGTRPGNRKAASPARTSEYRHPDTTRPRPWLPPTGE